MVRRRYGLRDDQWEWIKDILPGGEDSVGVTAMDNRLFVEAVLYRYRAGIPWRDLPERYGDWKNVHQRHSRWSESGVWEIVVGVCGCGWGGCEIVSRARRFGWAGVPIT
jgi:transposase